MGLLYFLLTLFYNFIIIIIITITWGLSIGFHSYRSWKWGATAKSFSSPQKHVKKVLSNWMWFWVWKQHMG